MSTTSAPAPALARSFVEDFAHRWLDAWNRHDAEGVAALCTPEIEFTDPAIGTVRGRRGRPPRLSAPLTLNRPRRAADERVCAPPPDRSPRRPPPRWPSASACCS